MHAGFVGQGGEALVVVAPDVGHGGVVDRVGDEHDTAAIGGDDRADLEVGRGDRLAVDEQPAGAVPVGAVDELPLRPQPRCAGDELDPPIVVVGKAHLGRPTVDVDVEDLDALVANATGSR